MYCTLQACEASREKVESTLTLAKLCRLVEQAQKTKYLWLDDVWVAGILGN